MAWMLGSPVAFSTRNYLIRSLTPKDITNRYVSWWNDPEIMEGIARSKAVTTVMHHRKRIATQFDNKTTFHLGVFDKDKNLLVGFIAIFCNPFHRTAWTNTIIGDRKYWGKNLVIEARGAVIDFIFNTLQMEKITGKPIARNIPSVFNYRAQGFTCEGILREEYRYEDGTRVDVCCFSMLRKEWEAIKAKEKKK